MQPLSLTSSEAALARAKNARNWKTRDRFDTEAGLESTRKTPFEGDRPRATRCKGTCACYRGDVRMAAMVALAAQPIAAGR